MESMSQSPSLSEMRLTSVALVAYAAFLRYDELTKLRCCDVKFLLDCMMLHITCSKIDQFCEGASVTVAHTGQPTCPVSMLEKYFAMAGLQHSSQERLFQGITVSKAGEKLRCSGSISYTRLRELLLYKLQELGMTGICLVCIV